jgi:hypothetical protein
MKRENLKIAISEKEQMVLMAYPNLDIESLRLLDNVTKQLAGVGFVSIKGYTSDVSNGTESANHIINIGASYENMKQKDANIYSNFDLNKVDVNQFNYETINTGKLSLVEYKDAVISALSIALEQLLAPKQVRVNNDVYINSLLIFNTNTRRLSIRGMEINKTVIVKGDLKIVKSAPLTVAKKLIEKCAKGRAQTLRRFALDNINTIKINGNTLAID